MSDEQPQSKLQRFRSVLGSSVRGNLVSGILALIFMMLGAGFVKLTETALWANNRSRFAKVLSRTPRDTKTVLAVFPHPSTSTVSKQLVESLGFNETTHEVRLLENVNLVLFYEHRNVDDTARALKQRLQDPGIILVVGHERSTTVQRMNAGVYEYEDADGSSDVAVPVPLILPAATNPALTATQLPPRRHILRLPANDSQQIDFIRKLVEGLKSKPKSVAVLCDKSNPTYADYFGQELAARSDLVDQSVGVELGGSDIPESALTRDVVVVAGMERLGKVMLTRLRKRPDSKPGSVVFTDGVAGDIFEAATKIKPPTKSLILLTGPFPTSAPKGEKVSFPNYKPYGEILKLVAIQLIQDTQEREKASAEPLTRKNVLATLQSWLGDQKQHSPKQLTFRETGDSESGEMHAYEIRDGDVFHYRACGCANP